MMCSHSQMNFGFLDTFNHPLGCYLNPSDTCHLGLVISDRYSHPKRNIIASGVSALCTIPYCSFPRESGPYCISDTAVKPLSTAKDRRLGRLLPHQQSNLREAVHSAIKSF